MIYRVEYRGYGFKDDAVEVNANSRYEAYDKAFFEIIPEAEGEMPYSAWVESVTYKSGRVHYFNTCEGLPY